MATSVGSPSSHRSAPSAHGPDGSLSDGATTGDRHHDLCLPRRLTRAPASLRAGSGLSGLPIARTWTASSLITITQGTVLSFDVLRAMPPVVAAKLRGFITAGSPLRKYVDLFSWGSEVENLATLPGNW